MGVAGRVAKLHTLNDEKIFQHKNFSQNYTSLLLKRTKNTRSVDCSLYGFILIYRNL